MNPSSKSAAFWNGLVDSEIEKRIREAGDWENHMMLMDGKEAKPRQDPAAMKEAARRAFVEYYSSRKEASEEYQEGIQQANDANEEVEPEDEEIEEEDDDYDW